MREHLHIGEVAKLVGVSAKTIRFYQEIGLLAEPGRSAAGYRLYTARDLLRLQRIRRLRSLGLPLERIRDILGEPGHEHEDIEPTLRAALHALIEELSTQINDLQERRERLQQLLAGESLEPARLPGEPAPSLYFDLVKEHLGEYFANISEEDMKWGEKVDALLGEFHWPAGYRATMEQAVQHIAAQPEQFEQLLALEARFAALAGAPEDSPEIEQLAEAYAQSGELGRFYSQFFATDPPMDERTGQTMVDLAAALVSPAQRRFFEALSRRLASSSSSNEAGDQPRDPTSRPSSNTKE
jgi:DNA-binding transcriptional MerR regulator